MSAILLLNLINETFIIFALSTGENDIEGACARSDAGDILSRLLCAVHGRGVTPAGSDGPLSPAHAIHAHTPSHPAPSRHDDPQLSTAAHTDMLLLNLMRINGLTPKCPKNVKHGELYDIDNESNLTAYCAYERW